MSPNTKLKTTIILCVFILVLTLISLTSIKKARAQAAIEWLPTNQALVGWDAATQLDDGSPVPDSDTVIYRLYLKRHGGTESTLAGETDKLEFLLTFTAEGRWLAGVQAVRQFTDPVTAKAEESPSTITWSDDPEGTNNSPFGFTYYRSPASPGGFHRK